MIQARVESFKKRESSVEKMSHKLMVNKPVGQALLRIDGGALVHWGWYHPC